PEKTTQEGKVDEAVKAATKAIKAATTPDVATQAGTNGVNTINGISSEPNTSDLEKAITAANTAKGTDNYKKADPDKKTAVDNALTAAKNLKEGKNADGSAVDPKKPITQNDIDAAKNALTKAVGGLNGDQKAQDEAAQKALETAKSNALQKVQKAAADKKAEIDSRLNDPEKTTQEGKVDEAVKAATKAIKAATT
ncbi:hypothetical protein, partial [Bartonella sp. CL63NXGY]|uniref:hypothetical protein n=1 Tax=Bartonella sp. CL63NXGY TaxID=3243538 RepID=UPI0035D0DD33